VSLYPSLGKMGIDSTTDYCWMKLGLAKKFPGALQEKTLRRLLAPFSCEKRSHDLPRQA
jgi:hypothetical protein